MLDTIRMAARITSDAECTGSLPSLVFASPMQTDDLAASESDSTTEQRLNQFLASVESRAFTMAHIATRSRDDALDIVQESMISLVTRYAKKPEPQWKPLFYRILHNKINDWHRKRTVRAKFHIWTGRGSDTDAETDELSEHDAAYSAADTTAAGDDALHDEQSMQRINTAVGKLPLRQQQAFMLRMWEGMDVRETATAMKCSEGSVKTHLSRAMTSLREQLEPLR